MKISNKTRHAIKIVTQLLVNGRTTAMDLSNHLDLSRSYIDSVCLPLRTIALIEVVNDRGTKSGYKLAPSGRDKNLWDIIHAFDHETWLNDQSPIDDLMNITRAAAMKIKVSDFAPRSQSGLSAADVRAVVDRTPLTDKEVEVVYEYANSKSAQEIADSLSISLHTVIRHKANIKEKMGFKSAACYARFAIKHNLIRM